VNNFLKDIAGEYGMSAPGIPDGALNELMKLEWTGNVRELRNVVERLIIMCDNKITEQDVLDYAVPQRRKSKGGSIFQNYEVFQEFKDHVEKEFITAKLEKHSWNISKTAESMEIQRSHLYNKMQKYGIQRAE